MIRSEGGEGTSCVSPDADILPVAATSTTAVPVDDLVSGIPPFPQLHRRFLSPPHAEYPADHFHDRSASSSAMPPHSHSLADGLLLAGQDSSDTGISFAALPGHCCPPLEGSGLVPARKRFRFRTLAGCSGASCVQADPSPAPGDHPPSSPSPHGGSGQGESLLAAVDRDRLRSILVTQVLAGAVSVVAMLFPYSLPVFAVTAAWIAVAVFRSRSHVGRNALVLFSLGAASLSALLALADFALVVYLHASRSLKTGLWWWGVVMVPGTYPVFVAHVALGLVCLTRIRKRVLFVAVRAATLLAQRPPSVTRYFRISKKRVVASSPDLAEIVVHNNPSQNVKKSLVQDAGVDEFLLEDALDPDQQPRVEFRAGHVAAVIKVPQSYREDDKHFFKVGCAGLFLFANRLIVVLDSSLPLFEGGPGLGGVSIGKTETVADATVLVLRKIVRMFEFHLKMIHTASEKLERHMDTVTDNAKLLHIFELEKALVYHVSALAANGSVMQRMTEKLVVQQPSVLGFAASEALADAIAENRQLQKMADLFCGVVRGLMDARNALVATNLNVMMKNMNALVLSVAVPSFVAGAGGMSEFSAMIGGSSHYVLGYFLFFIGCSVIGLTVFISISASSSLLAGARRMHKDHSH